jgi:hypothetical protein
LIPFQNFTDRDLKRFSIKLAIESTRLCQAGLFRIQLVAKRARPMGHQRKLSFADAKLVTGSRASN